MLSPSSNIKIGIIVPSSFEAKFVEPSAYEGHELIISGMGKIQSTLAVALYYRKVDHFLLTGFCGGIRGCDKGDVLLPAKIIEGDYDKRPIEVYPRFMQMPMPMDTPLNIPVSWATLVCQDRFLMENPYPWQDLVMATDMESYAVAYACEVLDIPCTIYKIVSDMVDGNAAKDFLESCTTLAPKLNELIRHSIKQITESFNE